MAKKAPGRIPGPCSGERCGGRQRFLRFSLPAFLEHHRAVALADGPELGIELGRVLEDAAAVGSTLAGMKPWPGWSRSSASPRLWRSRCSAGRRCSHRGRPWARWRGRGHRAAGASMRCSPDARRGCSMLSTVARCSTWPRCSPMTGAFPAVITAAIGRASTYPGADHHSDRAGWPDGSLG